MLIDEADLFTLISGVNNMDLAFVLDPAPVGGHIAVVLRGRLALGDRVAWGVLLSVGYGHGGPSVCDCPLLVVFEIWQITIGGARDRGNVFLEAVKVSGQPEVERLFLKLLLHVLGLYL